MEYLKGNLYEDKDDYAYDEIEVDAKGDKPTAGIYALEKSKVTTAVFCISGYVVNYSDNVAQAGEKCNPEDLKYKGSVKLSSTFGTYIYPETGIVEVIENISGGNLICSSSDEDVATCSIEGNIMTATSGTKEGTATITVISEATKKYKEAQAAYVVTSENGLLSVTASDKTVTYDGNAHSMEVISSGATIKYKDEEGNYTLDESPTYIDIGTYTIYYQVTKAGYKTVTDSKTLTIEAGTYTITFDANGGSVETTTKTVTYGEVYGELPIPTQEGHTFIGWYTDASGGVEVTSSTVVSILNNQTLYAQWEYIKEIQIAGSITSTNKDTLYTVDLTGYNKLIFNGVTSSVSMSNYPGWGGVETFVGIKSVSSSLKNLHALYANKTWNTSFGTISFDISNLNGTYELGCYAYQGMSPWGGYAQVTVTSIWITK